MIPKFFEHILKSFLKTGTCRPQACENFKIINKDFPICVVFDPQRARLIIMFSAYLLWKKVDRPGLSALRKKRDFNGKFRSCHDTNQSSFFYPLFSRDSDTTASPSPLFASQPLRGIAIPTFRVTATPRHRYPYFSRDSHSTASLSSLFARQPLGGIDILSSRTTRQPSP